MKLTNNAVAVLASYLLVACSSSWNIPPAEPRTYQGVRDASDWQNPYVVVFADGVEVRGIPGRASPEGLAAALKRVSRDAWPYGRVVAVQEIGIRSGSDDKLIRDNLAKVLKVLKDLDILVQQWPSA